MSKECPCCGRYMEEQSSAKWKARHYCENCGLYVYDRSEYSDCAPGRWAKERYTYLDGSQEPSLMDGKPTLHDMYDHHRQRVSSNE